MSEVAYLNPVTGDVVEVIEALLVRARAGEVDLFIGFAFGKQGEVREFSAGRVVSDLEALAAVGVLEYKKNKILNAVATGSK